MNETLLRQAMARGYCTTENEKKELDSTLIDAMVKEILSIPIDSLVSPTEPTFTQKQILQLVREEQVCISPDYGNQF